MRTFRLESAAIYWPGADPARGDTAEARGYSMQALRSVLAELATRTGGGPNLLRKCTERRLSGAKWLPDGRVVSTPGEGVIDSLVVPLFATLEVALRRIAGGANGDGLRRRAPPCHQMRGRVWVALGLLRWTLLLPDLPVDPAAKYELKETILTARLRTAALRRRVAALDQAVANGGDVSEPIRAATAAEAQLRGARDAARERVSARLPPPAPPFSQLHLEVHQWNRSLGKAETIIALSDDLMRAAGGADVANGGGNALAREAQWQQSSDRFVDRLAEGFGCFEDVACPLRLAMYEVKHGLRLLAACAAPTALAAEDRLAPDRTRAPSAGRCVRFSRFPLPETDESGEPSVLPLLRPLPNDTAVVPRDTARRVGSQSAMLLLALRRLYLGVLVHGGTRRRHLTTLAKIMGPSRALRSSSRRRRRRPTTPTPRFIGRRTRTLGAAAGDQVAEEAAALRELFPDFSDDFADLRRQAEEGLPPAAPGAEDDDDGDGRALPKPPTRSMPPRRRRRRGRRGGRRGGGRRASPRRARADAPAHLVPRSPLPRGRLARPPDRAARAAAAAARRQARRQAAESGGGAAGGRRRPRLGGGGGATRGTPLSRGGAPAGVTDATGADRGRAACHHRRGVARRARARSRVAFGRSCRGAPPPTTPRRRWRRRRRAAAAPTRTLRSERAAEVGRLDPILNDVAAKMRELLAQWPDHPALQLTQSVCERLRGFRPGTPLMKFVTGSELLLRHCSEWEAVACRATSIKPQIDALAALVLRWRKMELAAWPDLLARSARKERERALLTVWVRLFRLINAPLWRSAAAGVDGAAGTLEPDEDEAAADGDEDDDAERARTSEASSRHSST